jgi:K+-sensing histidine kinase KdpD
MARLSGIHEMIRFFYNEHRRGSWGKDMWLARRALRVAVSLALVGAVTAILWRIKVTVGGSHQFVYFYLFPVIWVRMLYSDALAALCAAVASVLANYYLQDPIYSLYNDNPLEYGDLVCFIVLSLLAIKCVFSEPLMPPRKKARRDDPAAGP